MIKWINLGFVLTFSFFISGCNTLLKPNSLYNSHIYGKQYNEDKHKFHDYASFSGPVFAVGYDKSTGFVTDDGGPWHWVGQTGWVTKENYSKKMQPFIKFLEWSGLPKHDQESIRLKYNSEAAIKDADIEFRYFNDGSPAFVDLAYTHNLTLENMIFDRSADYYTTQDVRKIVGMINAVLGVN
ncbi:hypothetical protein [[Enterobacter] lignolyticus]|nr:hypothetical protein [[Enterobacter] lignolyticus]